MLSALVPHVGEASIAVAAGLGAGAGFGLWLLISGLTGQARPGPELLGGPGSRRFGSTWGMAGRSRAWAHPDGLDFRVFVLARGSAALLAGVLVAALTRWPIAALAAATVAWLVPGMLAGPGSARARQRRMGQLEALANWTESLAATLAAAAGLEQAIVATTRTPPGMLAEPLRGLGDAVEAGARLPDVLAAFSRDVDNASTDAVVAALMLAATQGGSSLREPLTQLAQATRDEVTARQQIETGRAQIATDTRLIAALAAVVISALVVFNRGFLAPYDGPSGQFVLAVVLAMAGAAFAWMRRLAATQDPPRVVDLTAPAAAGASAGQR